MQYNYIYIHGNGITEINELKIIDRGVYDVYIVDGKRYLHDKSNCLYGDGFVCIFWDEMNNDYNIIDHVLLETLDSMHNYTDAIIQQFYDENNGE